MKAKDRRFSTIILPKREEVDSKCYRFFLLTHQFKSFSRYSTKTFTFWMLVACFALAEPLLCSRPPKGIIYYAQMAVLAVSSFLFIMQLVGVATREWDKIAKQEAISMSYLGDISLKKRMNESVAIKLFMFFTKEGEYVLECGLLIIGWIFIFLHPGIAILRCFRVFRLLW